MTVLSSYSSQKFADVKYRDCPWCGVRDAQFAVLYSQRTVSSHGEGTKRSWAMLACPRCAGVVAVEVKITNHVTSSEQRIHPTADVVEVRSVPEDQQLSQRVQHLPSDVAKFYGDALRVLDAGVPDAVAVQLRRTLEAAAADKGYSERVLVKNLEGMISDGLVTKDFGQALTHVRLLGNIGAHASDKSLSNDEVERALRFTTQFLRNVYEVPGELEELTASAASDDGDADGSEVEASISD